MKTVTKDKTFHKLSQMVTIVTKVTIVKNGHNCHKWSKFSQLVTLVIKLPLIILEIEKVS